MWLAWWVFFIIGAIVSALMWLLPHVFFKACDIEFGWTPLFKNEAGVIFMVFTMYYLALAGQATMFSAFFRSNIWGYLFGIAIIVFMIMLQDLVSLLVFARDMPRWIRFLVSLLAPQAIFAKVTSNLQDAATNRGGMKWSQIHDDGYECAPYCAPGAFCRCDYYEIENIGEYGSGEIPPEAPPPTLILPVAEALRWWLFHFVFYGLLGVYFDQIVPTGYGRVQPVYYFLNPYYWFPSSKKVTAGSTATNVTEDESQMDADVLNEMNRVLSGGANADAVRVVNLGKTFSSCCRPAFTAVYRINVGIGHEQLFCLLGHNGAGKTTTFNMLSGMFPSSKGDAFVFGYSVKHQLRSVQSLMGICPQHDVLWPELSGTEHLNLFAGLANIPRAEISRRVASFLQSVDLKEFANKACSKYSGGMRRRLSVACSLIADPKVVYLDEPTTGMDPVNRRGVWDVIEKAKKGRVVVLTTHAMEEADTLGDRISIMSRGRLHCLGTALHLKNKYGTGYTIDIKVPPEKQDSLLEEVKALMSDARAVGASEIAGTIQLNEVEKMAPLCAKVESGGTGADMTVSMCTLETVFIQIAEAANDPERQRIVAAGGGATASHSRSNLPVAAAVELQGGPSGGTRERQMTPPGQGVTTVMPDPASAEQPIHTITIPRTAGQKLGLDMEDRDGKVVVTKVHAGYAAASAGVIFAGDAVTEVAGTSTAGKNRDGVYKLIQGIKGSEIVLTLDSSARLGVTSPPPSPPQYDIEASFPSPPPSPPTASTEHTISIPRTAGQKLGLDMADQPGGKVAVAKVHPGYAAAEAGTIFAGDVVVAVDGTPVAGKKYKDVYRMIGGIQGDTINLTVSRSTTAPPPTTTTTTTSGGSGHGGSNYPVGGSGHSGHGYTDETDHHGVLQGTLTFTKTKFMTQFVALAGKNFTFQKRQPVLNCCCCIVLPIFFLAVFVFVQFIPAIFIGGNTIECGSTTLSTSSVDSSLLNENPTIIEDVISNLQRIDQITTPGRCPSRRELEDSGRFNSWVFSEGCSNIAVQQISQAEKATYASMRSRFGCDDDFYNQIVPKYQYVKDADVAADRCPLSGAQGDPNVTLVWNGFNVTREMGCYEAFGTFRATCTKLPPEGCPNNDTKGLQDGELTEMGTVLSYEQTYGCSTGISSKLNDFTQMTVEIMGVPVILPANVSKPYVAQCISENFLCKTPECEGVPAFLQGQGTYPTCTNDPIANAASMNAFLARFNYNPSAAAFGANDCLTRAAHFCKYDVAFRECPGLVSELRTTEFPYSVGPSMTSANIASLGEIRHSVAPLTACTDCFADLLNLSAVSASGALGEFTLKQAQSRDEAAMSLVTVACAKEMEGSAACDASRADIEALILQHWYFANFSSRDYGGGGRGGWGPAPPSAGRYQGAYHIDQFDTSTHTYEYTAYYNGTIGSTYDEYGEPQIGALLHRMASTIYKNIKGIELKVVTMGYPSFDATYMLDFTAGMAGFIFPAVLGFLQILLTFQIVAEKATNMRELMVMAGLGRRPYWTINWLYGYMCYLLEMVLFLVIAFAFGFKAIANHDFIVILIMLLLFSAQTVSYSCAMSTFFSSKWVRAGSKHPQQHPTTPHHNHPSFYTHTEPPHLS